MASFFGITSAKYQYAIDEYYRMKKEVGSPPHPPLATPRASGRRLRSPLVSVRQREEENEENRLSEEAERTFDRPQGDDEEDEAIAAAPADVSYQIETENPAPGATITVPAIVTAT